jgi:ABC-type transport system involved in cytochrome c biogenesis ATPase subunit
VLVKEITTRAELDHFSYLEGFHYKTSSAIVNDEAEADRKVAVGGRRSVLLCYLTVGRRTIPAGYIELQMPLQMVKPRHILFGSGYSHPTRAISWNAWNAEAIRQNVNLIVRIARVVTSPELRGIGLARLLIAIAKQYAKERWHVGGRRPLFIEISAEMLKYMDFATPAGLTYVGDTEGNLGRVHADLRSMLKGQKASFGMMTLQKKYLKGLQSIAAELDQPLESVLERIKALTAEDPEVPLTARVQSLAPEEWLLFKKVLRFPIPYYIGGLDEHSQEFIDSHVEKQQTTVARPTSVRPARIGLHQLQIWSTYSIPDSPASRAIRNCFGLDGNSFRTSLVGPLSIEASGGNILLVAGASGTGKSILLSAIDGTRHQEGLSISREARCGATYSAEWMDEIISDKPLIEYFSDRWGMDVAISALNRAGLAEAFVYLRPYRLLSRGQQYRARLAQLSLGTASVWLMDEFCADLDPFTARIVAANLRKHVVMTSRIAVVAAANHAHYIDALRPTKVLFLRHNGGAESFSYREYVDEFCISTR